MGVELSSGCPCALWQPSWHLALFGHIVLYTCFSSQHSTKCFCGCYCFGVTSLFHFFWKSVPWNGSIRWKEEVFNRIWLFSEAFSTFLFDKLSAIFMSSNLLWSDWLRAKPDEVCCCVQRAINELGWCFYRGGFVLYSLSDMSTFAFPRGKMVFLSCLLLMIHLFAKWVRFLLKYWYLYVCIL